MQPGWAEETSIQNIKKNLQTPNFWMLVYILNVYIDWKFI